MDPSIRYVPFESIQEVVVRSGLPWEELAGYVKVSGQRGRKVYVPRTQRVGHVDLSGFEMPPDARPPGLVDLDDDERWGAVRQQLTFVGEEGESLDRLVSVLEHMSSLPPVETRARAPRGTTGRGRGRPTMTVPPPEVPRQPAVEARQAKAHAARQGKGATSHRPAPRQGR